MSGFASASANQLSVPFIPKPFSLEALCATLGTVLTRSRELRQEAADGRRRASRERGSSERIRLASDASRTDALDLVAAALELRRQRAEPPATS